VQTPHTKCGRLSHTFSTASIAVGPAFLRYGGASPPAAIQSMKIHAGHRRIKIECVYRPYLEATEAAFSSPDTIPPNSRILDFLIKLCINFVIILHSVNHFVPMRKVLNLLITKGSGDCPWIRAQKTPAHEDFVLHHSFIPAILLRIRRGYQLSMTLNRFDLVL
jgi:hypothetical protein